jgi:fumarate reductase flavoprotein subunit
MAETFDVIIIGAGLAGHASALAAADKGASVLLLEKTSKPGGSTVQSAGSFALAGTAEQQAIGVEDSPEGLAAELTKVSGNKADPALVKLYVEHQAETYEWLKAQGVKFHKVSLSSNMAVPRTHPTDSKQLIQALNERVRAEKRITFRTGVAVKRLLTTVDRCEVLGVEAEVGGKLQELRARKGVVIASGGFTQSKELVEKFAPELHRALAWGGEQNTGDGLVMAWELGADVRDMGYVTGTFGVAVNHYPDLAVKPGDEVYLRMAMYRGGIIVNLEGKRFADESISYKKLGTACLAQTKGIAVQIFDQPIMDQSVPFPTSNDLKGVYEKGIIRSASTLRELAAKVQLDPDVLEATVIRYNRMVEEGNDSEFGRSSVGGGYGKPVTIANAPFYALPCGTGLLSTYCGLRVDTGMHVLTVRGAPIERLFAAGEVVGGFHGEGYMSGSSLGKAAIFGRVAGANAAALPVVA